MQGSVQDGDPALERYGLPDHGFTEGPFDSIAALRSDFLDPGIGDVDTGAEADRATVPPLISVYVPSKRKSGGEAWKTKLGVRKKHGSSRRCPS